MADSSDTARVRAVLDQFATALRNRDAAAAVALYADDAVDYDLAPPLRIDTRQLHDPANIQEWFDTWASPIESQSRNVTVRVGGDIAYAYGLRHMTGTKSGIKLRRASRKNSWATDCIPSRSASPRLESWSQHHCGCFL